MLLVQSINQNETGIILIDDLTYLSSENIFTEENRLY